MPRPTPAESVMPIDWSTRPSSSIAMHRLVNTPPSESSSEPPNSSGTTRPKSRGPPSAGRGRTGSGGHGPTWRRAAPPPRSRTRGRPPGSPRGPGCSSNIGAPSRRWPAPGRGATAYGHVLDVDVNVKQYSPVCQPPHGCRARTAAARPAAPAVPVDHGPPPRTWSIAEVAQEFGVTHRTVRHYEELGLITPERRGTPGSTTAATAPGWDSSCAASGSGSRWRRSGRSSTCTTCPGVGAASSRRPRPDRRAPGRPGATPARPRCRAGRAERVRTPLPVRPRAPGLIGAGRGTGHPSRRRHCRPARRRNAPSAMPAGPSVSVSVG